MKKRNRTLVLFIYIFLSYMKGRKFVQGRQAGRLDRKGVHCIMGGMMPAMELYHHIESEYHFFANLQVYLYYVQ